MSLKTLSFLVFKFYSFILLTEYYLVEIANSTVIYVFLILVPFRNSILINPLNFKIKI